MRVDDEIELCFLGSEVQGVLERKWLCKSIASAAENHGVRQKSLKPVGILFRIEKEIARRFEVRHFVAYALESRL